MANVILGDKPPRLPPGTTPGPLAIETVRQVSHVQSRYWNSQRRDPILADARLDTHLNKVTLTQALKRERTNELYDKYDMVEVDVPATALQQSIDVQVHVSKELLERRYDALILFAHDFGNLRVKASAPEKIACGIPDASYIVDNSPRLLAWARENNIGVIDVNFLSMLPLESFSQKNLRMRRPESTTRLLDAARDATKEVLLHVFDNYLDVASVRRFVMVGHGQATHPLLSLLRERSIRDTTCGVVQVVGMHSIPVAPKNTPDNFKSWYLRNSFVILPRLHPFYTIGDQQHSDRRLGAYERSGE